MAVDALDLQISAGEVFAYLGPNGAGKTTSIKMLVGLLLPTSGTVSVGGVDVVQSPREAKKRIGFVPDQPELYDKLTGREFLEFVADIRGMDRSSRRSAIEELAAILELETFLDQLTENYSHGMKQRIAVAAALVHSPDVLVLDEPMVGLDPRMMRIVKEQLRIRAAGGMSVFISTHTLAVAEEIADRIGVIDHGQLQFVGTKSELRSSLSTEDSSLEHLYLTLTENSANGKQDSAQPSKRHTGDLNQPNLPVAD